MENKLFYLKQRRNSFTIHTSVRQDYPGQYPYFIQRAERSGKITRENL
ncbi:MULTISPECIES: hypothetical protein [Bacteroides]|nr:hypothetical protein [Bacteroides fragilis]